MTTLITVDPGLSSGVVLGEYSEKRYYRRKWFAQVEGGAKALIPVLQDLDREHPQAVWIYEDFTARSTSGFSYTTKSLEPLVCIGAMMALGLVDRDERWQKLDPKLQYFAGGSSYAERKKNARTWLKEKGLLVTGKQVGCKDADDVNSATLQTMAWLRREKHTPTLKQYFRGE